jgi:hypothetical protein
LALEFLRHSLLSWPNSFDVWRQKWSNSVTNNIFDEMNSTKGS